MGCDVHPFVEIRKNGKWEAVEPDAFLSKNPNYQFRAPERLHDRSYLRFSFLTGGIVRSSGLDDLLPEPRGFPKDCSDYAKTVERKTTDPTDWGCHSHHHLTLAELLAVDYTQVVDSYYEEGIATLADELGVGFMGALEELKALGDPEDVRLLFYFDS